MPLFSTFVMKQLSNSVQVVGKTPCFCQEVLRPMTPGSESCIPLWQSSHQPSAFGVFSLAFLSFLEKSSTFSHVQLPVGFLLLWVVCSPVMFVLLLITPTLLMSRSSLHSLEMSPVGIHVFRNSPPCLPRAFSLSYCKCLLINRGSSFLCRLI